MKYFVFVFVLVLVFFSCKREKEIEISNPVKQTQDTIKPVRDENLNRVRDRKNKKQKPSGMWAT